MRSDEDKGREGSLLRGGVNWGQNYWNMRSCEDTWEGEEGGSFEKKGGQLGTGRPNWKRVNCRLRIQDLVMRDILAAKVFPLPLFLFVSLMACWKYWRRWRRLNRCLRALGAPRRPAHYNGILGTASHTFTILISNFPQRWNKYFTETVAVINPYPKDNWKLDWYKIYCFQTDAKYQIWSRNMNLSIFQQMLREIPVYRQERAEELMKLENHQWVTNWSLVSVTHSGWELLLWPHLTHLKRDQLHPS